MNTNLINYYNSQKLSSTDCKNNSIFNFLLVKRFLCWFIVKPALEKSLSLGTEVATVLKYFKANLDRFG